jgi:hypothetical protein
MIQRIIDWYNGYTLEDKLELEWLLGVAKELATDELGEKVVCNTKALVVNIENMDYNTNRIIAQINMMKLEGSTIRVKLNNETIDGKVLQFCREYKVEDIIATKK